MAGVVAPESALTLTRTHCCRGHQHCHGWSSWPQGQAGTRNTVWAGGMKQEAHPCSDPSLPGGQWVPHNSQAPPLLALPPCQSPLDCACRPKGRALAVPSSDMGSRWRGSWPVVRGWVSCRA